MKELSNTERLRYERNIKIMERALEIIRSNEPTFLKEIMLKKIGMDRETYGVIVQALEGDILLPQTDYSMLEWSITREIKSFKYALKK